ncbi:YueI family protein [Dendrosporobacter sp. 1207_IL3150]|uniref:YueI family protein n=1 Tax=Dendrosporobacter sp. 1207_IL3150 TaxID=3084054 RepID=UPI002FDABD84
MTKESNNSALGTWTTKSELEKVVTVGMHGVPEIKQGEKSAYLGEFKERILRSLTKEQVEEAAIYTEIKQALEDKRSAKLILSGDLDNKNTEKYQKLARKIGKPFVVRHDQKYKSDIGLVIASNEAVEIEDIEVEQRQEKLARLGLSDQLIKSAGYKICSECYDLLVSIAPEETVNYDRLNFLDRITGEKCPAHSD